MSQHVSSITKTFSLKPQKTMSYAMQNQTKYQIYYRRINKDFMQTNKSTLSINQITQSSITHQSKRIFQNKEKHF